MKDQSPLGKIQLRDIATVASNLTQNRMISEPTIPTRKKPVQKSPGFQLLAFCQDIMAQRARLEDG